MAADDLAVGNPDFLIGRHVFLLVEYIPGHAHDVLGPGAGFGQHGDDVLQRLPRLAREIAGVETTLCVPADHAADADGAAAGGDTVAVALGGDPAARLQDIHVPCSFICRFYLSIRPRRQTALGPESDARSSSRAMISCCTSVAPS